MSVIYDVAAYQRGRHVENEKQFVRRGHKIRIWTLDDGEIITIIEKLPPKARFTSFIKGFRSRREAWRGIYQELKNAAG